MSSAQYICDVDMSMNAKIPYDMDDLNYINGSLYFNVVYKSIMEGILIQTDVITIIKAPQLLAIIEGQQVFKSLP